MDTNSVPERPTRIFVRERAEDFNAKGAKDRKGRRGFKEREAEKLKR